MCLGLSGVRGIAKHTTMGSYYLGLDASNSGSAPISVLSWSFMGALMEFHTGPFRGL